MTNSKITLEALFNLLNSVPSADRSDVIDVAYSAVKVKIDELVQNYNQIYAFYQQLTSFSILTGENFKIIAPDVVDYNLVSKEIQNSVCEKSVVPLGTAMKSDDKSDEAPIADENTEQRENETEIESSKQDVSESDESSNTVMDDQTENQPQLENGSDTEQADDLGVFPDDVGDETEETDPIAGPNNLVSVDELNQKILNIDLSRLSEKDKMMLNGVITLLSADHKKEIA